MHKLQNKDIPYTVNKQFFLYHGLPFLANRLETLARCATKMTNNIIKTNNRSLNGLEGY